MTLCAVATDGDAPQRTSGPPQLLVARGVPPVVRPGQAMTGPEMAAQIQAAFPGWIVWWGEYTREFWAMPIPVPGMVCPPLRASAGAALGDLIRKADARRGGGPPARRPADSSGAGSGGGSGRAAAHGGGC